MQNEANKIKFDECAMLFMNSIDSIPNDSNYMNTICSEWLKRFPSNTSHQAGTLDWGMWVLKFEYGQQYVEVFRGRSNEGSLITFVNRFMNKTTKEYL